MSAAVVTAGMAAAARMTFAESSAAAVALGCVAAAIGFLSIVAAAKEMEAARVRRFGGRLVKAAAP